MTEFRTTDVDLAAFLSTRGLTVLRVDPPQERPWLAEFVFENVPAVDVACSDWEGGEASVDAREFAKQRVRLYRWARSALDATHPAHARRGRDRR